MKQKIKVVVAPSRIHGRGLFAGQKIPEDSWVMKYAGEKIDRREGRRRDRFYLSIGYSALFDAETHYIDGVIGGNESIYINHSKSPNLEALLHRGGVWFRALRDIAKGEELTFDYGFDPAAGARKRK
ncbi:MAG: SET domain-containing protein [Beijerinckiaceae bacterium]